MNGLVSLNEQEADYNIGLTLTVENLNVFGIYEDWQFGNPTFGFNPIFMTWSILDNESITTLMDSDHGYLGVAIDQVFCLPLPLLMLRTG